MEKVAKGSNPHGFKNEELIVDALNNKKIKELKGSLSKFIKDICKDNLIEISEESIVKAKIERNNKLKQDFYIIIGEKEFGISIKMGQSNSVHQEKIEGFIEWLDKTSMEKMTNEIKDDLRFFIWADGTTNGKAPIKKAQDGKIIGRFGCNDFKKLYPEKRNAIQDFIEKNEEIILNRAIFEGKNNSKVDYVYHGTPLNGVWLSKKEVIEFNIQNPKSKDPKNRATMNVGRLSIQPWNSDLKGNNEKKRGEIQLKYSSMTKDFENLMFRKSNNIGTFEGDQEEFNLSRIMNRNKNHKFWKVLSKECDLNKNKDNYYIVKVEGNKKSELCGKKVKCKTDNFIIKADISKTHLLQWEYQITENMLDSMSNYEIIEHSGISVKKADSKRYTIVKLTHSTFKTAFEKYIDEIQFIIAGLLVYSDKKKVHINEKIIKDLKINEEDLKQFYSNRYGIIGSSIIDVNFMTQISRKSKEIVKEVIENNYELKEKLFKGIGWFKNPYCIDFIFKHGELTSDIYTDYVISNGSGRSKGTYTITLKPKQ